MKHMHFIRFLPFLTLPILAVTQPPLAFDKLGTPAFEDLNTHSKTTTETHESCFSEGNRSFKAGKFDDAIKYYQKAIAIDPFVPQVHFNLGLAYEEKGTIDEAIEAYLQAINNKNDYAKAYRQIAPLIRHKGRVDEAIEYYKKAVEFDHSYDAGYVEIARLLCEREKFAEAIPYYEKAMPTKEGDLNVKFEYGNTLNTVNRCAEALDVYKDILKARPTDSSVLYNTAFTLKKMGRIEEAMPYYDATLKQKPDHTEAKFSRGLAYLLSGNFEKGWPDYEYRWQRGSQLEPREFKQPLWDGSSLKGKTILIHAEQGLGDTFQFIRYAKLVKEHYEASTIIFASQRPLYSFVSRCCPYLDKVITLDQMSSVQFDCHCPMLTFPLVLKSDEKTMPRNIPYIIPETTLVEVWRRKLASDSNLKVGICWQGNAQYSTAFLRAVVAAKSIPLKKFAPLFTVPGVSFYSLQRENGVDQVKGFPHKESLKTFDADFDKRFGRFMDTAALIKNLDLVITVDTSISHLAGAIGVPVWILVPEPPDWRWMFKRTDTPWYPNMRLFRQQIIGDWDGVLATVAEELFALVHARRTETGDAPDFAIQAMPGKPSSDDVSGMACRATTEATCITKSIASKSSPIADESTSSGAFFAEQLLRDELQTISRKIETLAREIRKNDAAPDSEEYLKTMRSLLRLTDMKNEIVEKLKRAG